MTDPRKSDHMVDALFDAARKDAGTPEPSTDFMARLLDDADAAMPALQPRNQPLSPPARWEWLRELGGWPTLSGFATAAVAGVWIGAAPPDALQSWTDSVVFADMSVGLTADLGLGLEE